MIATTNWAGPTIKWSCPKNESFTAKLYINGRYYGMVTWAHMPKAFLVGDYVGTDHNSLEEAKGWLIEQALA